MKKRNVFVPTPLLVHQTHLSVVDSSVQGDALTAKPFKYAALVHRISDHQRRTLTLAHDYFLSSLVFASLVASSMTANRLAVTKQRLLPNCGTQWTTDKNRLKHFARRSSGKRIICNGSNGRRWTQSLSHFDAEYLSFTGCSARMLDSTIAGIYAFGNGNKKCLQIMGE